MRKQELEAVLNTTSIKPVYRTKIRGEEVYIADGFVPADQLRFLDRFGVKATKEEFPMGAYATLWYADRKVGWGGTVVCDALHEVSDTLDSRKAKRIMSAVELAKQHFNRYGALKH